MDYMEPGAPIMVECPKCGNQYIRTAPRCYVCNAPKPPPPTRCHGCGAPMMANGACFHCDGHACPQKLDGGCQRCRKLHDSDGVGPHTYPGTPAPYWPDGQPVEIRPYRFNTKNGTIDL